MLNAFMYRFRAASSAASNSFGPRWPEGLSPLDAATAIRERHKIKLVIILSLPPHHDILKTLLWNSYICAVGQNNNNRVTQSQQKPGQLTVLHDDLLRLLPLLLRVLMRQELDLRRERARQLL